MGRGLGSVIGGRRGWHSSQRGYRGVPSYRPGRGGEYSLFRSAGNAHSSQ